MRRVWLSGVECAAVLYGVNGAGEVYWTYLAVWSHCVGVIALPSIDCKGLCTGVDAMVY